MDKINDGGPAFPHLETTSRGEPYHDHLGMSLRDYFAGQALGALVNGALDANHISWDATGEHAYFVADAMLKARGAKQ